MDKEKNFERKLMRFRKSEINLHWALAVPFMICYVTALALVIIFNPDPSHPYREIVSWIHRISGVCLIILPLAAIIINRRDLWIHSHNIKHAWTMTLGDIKWLCLMGPAAVSKRVSLPDQGKFNAAEKINFMTLTATYPLYIVTGIVIWATNGLLLSWLIHFGMAVIATPLMGGHLFMAMINPSSRVALPGMFSGFVDPEFVKHHHTQWFNENFEDSYEVTEPDMKFEDSYEVTEPDIKFADAVEEITTYIMSDPQPIDVPPQENEILPV